MQTVIGIVKQLESTSGRNDKVRILKRHQDNELLKKVLLYTYDFTKVYGVGKKTLEGFVDFPLRQENESGFNDVFEMLDYLQGINLNNEVKAKIFCFITSHDKDERELYVRMLLKDLRIGATTKTINDAYGKLIPDFNVQLAQKFEDHADKVLGKELIISTKLDGIRLILLKEGDNIKLITRQGKLLDGCVEIEEEAAKLNDGAYDGELLKVNTGGLDSKELYQATKKITGKKGIKRDLEFHVFDYLSVDEFKNGESEHTCLNRKAMIKEILCDKGLKYIKEVPVLAITKDHKEIKALLDNAINNGQEGVMANVARAKYEFKRTNKLLKCKQFYTMDLEIIGFEEGQGRNAGTLGRVNVDFKGFVVGVGSGFTDEERDEIWSNKDRYLGRVMEVNYFEVTTDQHGNESLRFPTFNCIRESGKEVSYD